MDDKFRLNIPRYSLLTEEKREFIHLATLEVLRRTGLSVKDKKALRIYHDGGCIVEGDRVRMPAHLVEWALRNTSPRIPLCTRDGEPAMFLEQNNGYFGTGSDTPNVIDVNTGKRRTAVLQDVANAAKLVDSLPDISFNMSAALAGDVNSAISDIYHFFTMIKNSRKPLVFTTWSLDNLKTIVEMAEMVAGGARALRNRPFLVLYAEPISPLTIPEESAQEIMFMAEKSLPIIFTPAVLTGATGPSTIAGGIVQANAEMLGGYVLGKLVNKEIPFLYGECALPMDMRTGQAPYVTPEYMLANTAFADMARYYRLPMFSVAGCTDSNLPDQQATMEGAMWIVLTSLNGGNLIHDVGYMDGGLTTSLELIVVFNEVIRMMRRFTRGFDISYKTAALDLIHEVGPGGEYLSSEHTLNHFKENFYSDLLSKDSYEAWEKGDKKNLIERANDKVKNLLENHKPEPLDENLEKELKKIIAVSEKLS